VYERHKNIVGPRGTMSEAKEEKKMVADAATPLAPKCMQVFLLTWLWRTKSSAVFFS
jgi:hypothetical protein